jgi:ubiquinone/menaquinone biosynthesis C-methylase UbiE
MQPNKINWGKLKEPYYLRSKKYEEGTYLELERKHKGILEYIDVILSKQDRNTIDFCDAGCGNGIYLNYLKNKYQSINLYGFDFSEKIIEIAKDNTKIKEIRVGNLENIQFDDKSFDLILCAQVIEHLLDDKKGISELYRILKTNGYLIISTDNKYNIISILLDLPLKIFLSPYTLIKKLFKNKKNFPHKSYFMKEFKDLIKTQNFEIEKFSTFRFSMPFPFHKIKFMRNIINIFELFCGKIGIFKNNGDIIVALCKKI